MNDSKMTEGMQDVLRIVDGNPDKELTIKQLSKMSGYSQQGIRNMLIKGKPLNNHLRKTKKGNLLFLQAIPKPFYDYARALDIMVKSKDIKDIFNDLFIGKIPLGIHYIKLKYDKDNTIKSFYNDCKWKFRKGRSKEKEWLLKGKIASYGKTAIHVSEGKKTKKPSINIIYNGNFAGSKDYLTEKEFPIWFDLLEQFILNALNRNYRLSEFFISQIEYNFDTVIGDKNKKNRRIIKKFQNRIRIHHLKEAIEIYPYEDDDGTIHLRLGKNVNLKEKKKEVKLSREISKVFTPEKLFGFDIPQLSLKVDKALDDINKYLDIRKSVKALVNNDSIQIDMMKELIKKVPENLNEIRTKINKRMKSNEETFHVEYAKVEKSFKSGLEQMQEFATDERKLLNKEFKNLKQDTKKEVISIKKTLTTTNKSLNNLGAVFNKLDSILQNVSQSLNINSQALTLIIDLQDKMNDSNKQINGSIIKSNQERHNDIIDSINLIQTNFSTLFLKMNDRLSIIETHIIRKKRRFRIFSRQNNP